MGPLLFFVGVDSHHDTIELSPIITEVTARAVLGAPAAVAALRFCWSDFEECEAQGRCSSNAAGIVDKKQKLKNPAEALSLRFCRMEVGGWVTFLTALVPLPSKAQPAAHEIASTQASHREFPA